MGIDSIKPKGPSVVGQPKEAAPVEETPAANPPPEPEAPAAAEGFDDPKNKLVSVTGGYKAFQPSFAPRPDLQAEVAALRGGGGVSNANAKTLKDTGLKTAADVGAGPGPRPAAADFTAQAKAALPATASADDIKAKAIELGKTALQKDFGLNVKDGTKKWDPEALSRMYESFSKFPAGDKAKLQGLDLIRDEKASAKSQAEAKGGVVAGEYAPNVDTKDGARIKGGAISIYDAALPKPDKSDDASRQTTMHVVLHEAGHAVEGRARDDAMAKFNEANDKQTAANTALKKATPDQSVYDNLNNAPAQYTYYDAKGETFAKKQEAVGSALKKLNDAKTPADITKAQGDLDKAKKARDEALGKMSGNKSESAAKDWIAATDAAEGPIKTYAQAHVDYLGAEKAATDAQTKLTAVSTADDGATSKELAAFEKQRGTESQVSTYGASDPQEGYAEAFALYNRDPAKMKSDFPNQYKYFHQHHKSPNDP